MLFGYLIFCWFQCQELFSLLCIKNDLIIIGLGIGFPNLVDHQDSANFFHFFQHLVGKPMEKLFDRLYPTKRLNATDSIFLFASIVMTLTGRVRMLFCLIFSLVEPTTVCPAASERSLTIFLDPQNIHDQASRQKY